MQAYRYISLFSFLLTLYRSLFFLILHPTLSPLSISLSLSSLISSVRFFSLSLSFSVSLSPSICIPFFFCLSLYISHSIPFSIFHLFLYYLYICLFISPSLFLSRPFFTASFEEEKNASTPDTFSISRIWIR